jgi:hypothetical protein
MQLRHVVDEPVVLDKRDPVVALGDEVVGDVAHDQHRSPALGAFVPSCGGDRVVDRGRQLVEPAIAPHGDRAQPDVAGGTHQPVLGGMEVLEHVGRPVDGHPLEAGAGLAVVGAEWHAGDLAAQQLVERGGDGARRAWRASLHEGLLPPRRHRRTVGHRQVG